MTDLEMKQRERNREGMLMEIKEIEGGHCKVKYLVEHEREGVI